MATDPKPPLLPNRGQPKLEEREDIKTAKAEDLATAARLVRRVRIEGRRSPRPEGDVKDEYLAALQDFLMELEPYYVDLQVGNEYWTEEGPPLATLQTPGLSVEQLLDFDPARVATGGYPRVLNTEVLEPRVVRVLESLTDVLDLESTEIPFTVTLQLQERGQRTETVTDTMRMNWPALDRARRWGYAFASEIGLSLDRADDREHGKAGGEGRYASE